ncbi:MAG: hydrolase [Candidatus Nomurabacteria bacterium]|jgi:nicotinamidase-related amidase|nr:hydrolase [Candidatus Nomurabacteria bacterium]
MNEMRDPKTDHLITPENAALVVIDYQPTQVNSINSMSREKLVHNINVVAKIAKAYNLPVVLTTVNVANGRNKDTIDSLKTVLSDAPSIDRTTMNSWEDVNFRNAVNAMGRKKILMTALWTEVCLTFPTLDMIKEGYEIYPIVDAVGGTSKLAHDTALRRVEQAGAQLVTIPGLLCELQRDWSRTNTASDFLNLMFESGAFLKV